MCTAQEIKKVHACIHLSVYILPLFIIYEHNNTAMGILFICLTVHAGFAANTSCYLVNIYLEQR